ncbi:hypothetical protein DERF_008265 [Dermatophagoides farinae]|uniref:Uncharacterized protein n=1 Tax=Dermatophagoides farinae TaxID=6954 RepID=A0A922I5A8_DERFA|nr:hypothetical protein DERF_008265 [Dermatophagoides farinae]
MIDLRSILIKGHEKKTQDVRDHFSNDANKIYKLDIHNNKEKIEIVENHYAVIVVASSHSDFSI